VLGDPVNLASRLEGRSKEYGTPIIIGARTAEKVKDRFATLQIDLITVKGKTEPESIYALLGDQQVGDSEGFKTVAALMQDMLACYRNRDWAGAENALQRARSAPDHFSLDAIYGMYDERIQTFRKAPPPDSWDGVYAFDRK
jgi:adenylate cyclase